MKLKFLLFGVFGLLLLSCRGEDVNDLQKIDQVINLYIQNANGVDLLNTENTEAYTSITLQDLNDPNTALKPISSFSTKKDMNGVSYIDYVAGATRILQGSPGQYPETYQSEFYINLIKTVNNQSVIDVDTIKVQYSLEPTLFQVSKIWYNKQVFNKVVGQANIVKIVK